MATNFPTDEQNNCRKRRKEIQTEKVHAYEVRGRKDLPYLSTINATVSYGPDNSLAKTSRGDLFSQREQFSHVWLGFESQIRIDLLAPP